MKEISLIANTGIQFYKTHVSINLNDHNGRCRMYFHEYIENDEDGYPTINKVELVHRFNSDEEVYVSQKKLYDSLNIGLTSIDNSLTVEKVREQLQDDFNELVIDEESVVSFDFFKTLHPYGRNGEILLDKMLDKWLPFPYFVYKNMEMEQGPYNWSRIMIIPQQSDIPNVLEWDIVIAFDTTTSTDVDAEEDYYQEQPMFTNIDVKSLRFGVCQSDLMLMNFISNDTDATKWIDEYLNSIMNDFDDDNFQHAYIAAYCCLLKTIFNKADLPEVTLYASGKNIEYCNVDLSVDIGNSATTALLVHNGELSKSVMLDLQDYTQPQKSSSDPFEMNMVFKKVNFGNMPLLGSSQFVYPSFVRLGNEAKRLIMKITDNQTQSPVEYMCSSPKHYLWDNHERKEEWKSVEDDNINGGESFTIEGISDQINSDGSLVIDGNGGGYMSHYSRRSLMTFAFMEIFVQAFRQMNSYDYRQYIGENEESKPRQIGKIIISCPTTMSKREQISLRKAAAEARMILKRYMNHTYNMPIDYKQVISEGDIVPSIRDLNSTEEAKEWHYDEATCAQFVYLCAEIVDRYKQDYSAFFDHYGKVRSDLENYDKKSITIGSLDIGAGTTDLMICAYEYIGENQFKLKPVPLYWDSFYVAGDDLMQVLVHQLIVEGPNARLDKYLREKNPTRSNEWVSMMLANFFGKNVNNSKDCQRRKNFNIQIAIPIIMTYLEETSNQSTCKKLNWDEFFKDGNYPNESLLVDFKEYFGFDIREIEWEFDPQIVNQIITNKFDNLFKKIAAIFSIYQCDVVLLSGRPTSLKQIENIFLKYYPVSPNRLKVMGNYRVGRWYPFHDGNGYLQNVKGRKSIVAVGAYLGYYASNMGSFHGLRFDFSELNKRLVSTVNYIVGREGHNHSKVLLAPNISTVDVSVSEFPTHIGVRQLNSDSYPTRCFYSLDIDQYELERLAREKGFIDIADIKKFVAEEYAKILRRTPLRFTISRPNFPEDKESIEIDSVEDNDGNSIRVKYFTLDVKIYDDKSGACWLDSGALNLSLD